MTESRPGGFSDVDAQQDVSFFIRVLEAQDDHPGISRARATALELLDPQVGTRILDAGCGLGTAACQIASRGISVVALDVSETMLSVARTKARDGGCYMELVHGDVTDLDFDDDSFDAARSERVFQHLADPSRALSELVRVVRPGGRIVVADTDWDSFSIDLPDQEIVTKLRAASLHRFASPAVGRALYGLFKRAGLADVRVEAVPVVFLNNSIPGTDIRPAEMTVNEAVERGGLTGPEGDAVLAQVAAAEKDDAVFMSFVMYVVAGEVPGAR